MSRRRWRELIVALVLVVVVAWLGLAVIGAQRASTATQQKPEHPPPYWWLDRTPSPGESIPPAPGAAPPPGATPWPIASGPVQPSPPPSAP
jgi:hypothetical protein